MKLKKRKVMFACEFIQTLKSRGHQMCINGNSLKDVMPMKNKTNYKLLISIFSDGVTEYLYRHCCLSKRAMFQKWVILPALNRSEEI